LDGQVYLKFVCSGSSAPQVSFEAKVKTCKIAEADDFIKKLPEKYQTVLEDV
jgi:ABC-type bacteriocin/lantibiotic exporter with double-glycine peptidase domain